MEYKQIQELIKTINKSNISELSVEEGDFKITIKQAQTISETQFVAVQAPMPQMLPQAAPQAAALPAAPAPAAQATPAAAPAARTDPRDRHLGFHARRLHRAGEGRVDGRADHQCRASRSWMSDTILAWNFRRSSAMEGLGSGISASSWLCSSAQ